MSGVEVPTACGQSVLLDAADADWLGDRRLSLGSHGYAQTYVDGRVDVLHRVLLGLRPRDGLIGDHVNGDPLDCRRANLRVVTASESSANVSARGSSGYRGVYPCKGRWQAAAKQDGRKVHLGTFDSPEEAARVAHAWRMTNLPGYVDRPDARRVAA